MIVSTLIYHCDNPGCEKFHVEAVVVSPYHELIDELPKGWHEDRDGTILCPACAPKEPTPWPLPKPNPVIQAFVEKAVEQLQQPLSIPHNYRTTVPKTEREPGCLEAATDTDGHTHHTFKP